VSARTLVDLLRERAQATPGGTAFTFLSGSSSDRVTGRAGEPATARAADVEERAVTYAELDVRARTIAATLTASAAPGGRALLLYPPGVDYVAGFFGCLYAGLVAVPAYPPEAGRARTTAPRLHAIIESARASVVLGPTAAVDAAPSFTGASAAARAARWIAADTLSEHVADAWRAPSVVPGSVALLQFTSGSTSSPRGVVLTHAHLLANIADIGRAFGVSLASRGVIWLPPFHDMGLIGGILLPIVAGFPVALMAPRTFLQRPLRWLRAISRHRATISGGPNFAYDLCARKATPTDVAGLDLSSWEVAFTGAEPVRAETLERFAATFAPAGFRPSSFLPCYGLAEATLMATSARRGAGAVVRVFDAPSLEAGIVAPADRARAPRARSRAIVAVGTPPGGTRVHVVDPETLAPSPPGRIGEVWVTGPGVAAGYFERPEDSARPSPGASPGSTRARCARAISASSSRGSSSSPAAAKIS